MQQTKTRKKGGGTPSTLSKSDQKSTDNNNVKKKSGNQSSIITLLLGVSVASLIAIISVTLYFYFQNSSNPTSQKTLSKIERLNRLAQQKSSEGLASPHNQERTDSEHKKVKPTWIKKQVDLDENAERYDYSFVVGSVERREWSPEKDVANEIFEIDRPIILTNTIASQWRAQSLWTPSYISSHLPYMSNIQKYNKETFMYYHSSKAMGPYVDHYRTSTTWEKVNMTSEEFFVKTANPPPYYYYTTQGHELGQAYNDLYPIEPLMIKGKDFNKEESYKFRWTNVWIGGGGATTQAHYDVYHNFYVQVHGKKKFVLFAPEEHENLYIYPYLHPGSLQSQVNFSNPDLVNFPNFSKAKAYQAVLYPGDVLFIPAFWFHHVKAIDLSISVSVWTKMEEANVIHSTWQGALPFKASWSPEKLHWATRIYLERLIDSIYGQGSAKPFIENLINQRYRQVIKENPSLHNTSATFCPSSVFGGSKEQLEELKAFESELEVPFSDFISDLTPKYQGVPNKSRRDLWVGHLVEQVVWSVVGVTNVSKFLTDFVNC